MLVHMVHIRQKDTPIAIPILRLNIFSVATTKKTRKIFVFMQGNLAIQRKPG